MDFDPSRIPEDISEDHHQGGRARDDAEDRDHIGPDAELNPDTFQDDSAGNTPRRGAPAEHPPAEDETAEDPPMGLRRSTRNTTNPLRTRPEARSADFSRASSVASAVSRSENANEQRGRRGRGSNRPSGRGRRGRRLGESESAVDTDALDVLSDVALRHGARRSISMAVEGPDDGRNITIVLENLQRQIDGVALQPSDGWGALPPLNEVNVSRIYEAYTTNKGRYFSLDGFQRLDARIMAFFIHFTEQDRFSIAVYTDMGGEDFIVDLPTLFSDFRHLAIIILLNADNHSIDDFLKDVTHLFLIVCQAREKQSRAAHIGNFQTFADEIDTYAAFEYRERIFLESFVPSLTATGAQKRTMRFFALFLGVNVSLSPHLVYIQSEWDNAEEFHRPVTIHSRLFLDIITAFDSYRNNPIHVEEGDIYIQYFARLVIEGGTEVNKSDAAWINAFKNTLGCDPGAQEAVADSQQYGDQSLAVDLIISVGAGQSQDNGESPEVSLNINMGDSQRPSDGQSQDNAQSQEISLDINVDNNQRPDEGQSQDNAQSQEISLDINVDNNQRPDEGQENAVETVTQAVGVPVMVNPESLNSLSGVEIVEAIPVPLDGAGVQGDGQNQQQEVNGATGSVEAASSDSAQVGGRQDAIFRDSEYDAVELDIGEIVIFYLPVRLTDWRLLFISTQRMLTQDWVPESRRINTNNVFFREILQFLAASFSNFFHLLETRYNTMTVPLAANFNTMINTDEIGANFMQYMRTNFPDVRTPLPNNAPFRSAIDVRALFSQLFNSVNMDNAIRERFPSMGTNMGLFLILQYAPDMRQTVNTIATLLGLASVGTLAGALDPQYRSLGGYFRTYNGGMTLPRPQSDLEFMCFRYPESNSGPRHLNLSIMPCDDLNDLFASHYSSEGLSGFSLEQQCPILSRNLLKFNQLEGDQNDITEDDIIQLMYRFYIPQNTLQTYLQTENFIAAEAVGNPIGIAAYISPPSNTEGAGATRRRRGPQEGGRAPRRRRVANTDDAEASRDDPVAEDEDESGAAVGDTGAPEHGGETVPPDTSGGTATTNASGQRGRGGARGRAQVRARSGSTPARNRANERMRASSVPAMTREITSPGSPERRDFLRRVGATARRRGGYEVVDDDAPQEPNDAPQEPSAAPQQEPNDAPQEPSAAPQQEPNDAPQEPSAAPQQEQRPAPQQEQRPAPQQEQRPAPQQEQRPVPQQEQRPAPQQEQRPAPQQEQRLAPQDQAAPQQVQGIRRDSVIERQLPLSPEAIRAVPPHARHLINPLYDNSLVLDGILCTHLIRIGSMNTPVVILLGEFQDDEYLRWVTMELDAQNNVIRATREPVDIHFQNGQYDIDFNTLRIFADYRKIRDPQNLLTGWFKPVISCMF